MQDSREEDRNKQLAVGTERKGGEIQWKTQMATEGSMEEMFFKVGKILIEEWKGWLTSIPGQGRRGCSFS